MQGSIRALALTFIIFLAFAATASAKTNIKRTTASGVSTLTITGDATEEHDISVSFDDSTNRYEVTDDAAPIDAGSNCILHSAEENVTCAQTSPPLAYVVITTGSFDDSVIVDLENGESVSMSTGGGDDFINGSDGHDDVDAGSGDDSVDTGAGNDSITAGAGDDSIDGGPGDDSMLGGDGNDILSGEDGTDVFSGGAGTDAADYSDMKLGVAVDLDGNADDGLPNEHDNVKSDVENLTGGAGNDTLTGSAGVNVLIGNGGDDRIQSRDTVSDTVNCGIGNDSVAADTLDALTQCESADRDTSKPIPSFKVTIKDCKGSASAACVAIACVGASSCSGDVSLATAAPIGKSAKKRKKSRTVKLGSAKFSGGASSNVKVKLNSAAKRMLRKKGKLNVRATVNAQDASGHKESSIGSLKLRVSKRR